MSRASRKETLVILGLIGAGGVISLLPRERFAQAWGEFSQFLDHQVGWDTLPPLLGAFVLPGLRVILRRDNLQDTQHYAHGEPDLPKETPPQYLTARSPDGTYNSLTQPWMGSAGTRFGRNVPNEHTYPEPPDVMNS